MKKVAIILWLLLFISLCLAQPGEDNLQAKPNLNGTWQLDMAGSDFGVPRRDLKYSSLTLVLSYHEPELKIVCKRIEKRKERTLESVYYTDGRGEKNPSFYENETVETKTYWEGYALVTKGSVFQSTFGDTIMYDIIDKWELSADGNTLTETSYQSAYRSKYGKFNFGSLGERTARKVFKKSS